MVIWLVGPSLEFPSNLGMFDGILVGIGGQARLYRTRSLVNFERSGKLRVSRNGKKNKSMGFQALGLGFQKFGNIDLGF